ncbi:MAG TPA: flagellar hook-length control protein FliK [Glaciihabitans sp.]|nr:flagellar hook-length control protein FliK [Glaciihabitans sp.]
MTLPSKPHQFEMPSGGSFPGPAQVPSAPASDLAVAGAESLLTEPRIDTKPARETASAALTGAALTGAAASHTAINLSEAAPAGVVLSAATGSALSSHDRRPTGVPQVSISPSSTVQLPTAAPLANGTAAVPSDAVPAAASAAREVSSTMTSAVPPVVGTNLRAAEPTSSTPLGAAVSAAPLARPAPVVVSTPTATAPIDHAAPAASVATAKVATAATPAAATDAATAAGAQPAVSPTVAPAAGTETDGTAGTTAALAIDRHTASSGETRRSSQGAMSAASGLINSSAVADNSAADAAQPDNPALVGSTAGIDGTARLSSPTSTSAAPVSSTPPALASFAKQVGAPVFALIAGPEGDHSVTVTVAPSELGPVTVRAHLSGDGIRIEMFAPTESGREALRQILTDLRRDVAIAGSPATVNLATDGGHDGRQHRTGAEYVPGANPRTIGNRQSEIDEVSARPTAGSTLILDVMA